MRATSWGRRAGVLLCAAVWLAACGRDQGSDASLEAALVPGADLVVRVDARAVREAAVFSRGEESKKAASEPESRPPTAEAQPGTREDFDGEHFLAVTGLSAEDVLAVLVSADLAQLDVSTGDGSASDTDGEAVQSEASRLEKVTGVAAVQLAKAVSLDALEKGVRESLRGEAAASVSRVEVGGRPALKLDAPDPKEPDLYVAGVAGDRVMLVAPNTTSLEGALERAASGRFAELPADLARVDATLPPAALARVAFVVPQKLRDAIEKQLDDPTPENAMAMGFAQPFRNLRSIAFGLEAAESLTAVLATDLGDESAAQQARSVLGGLVGPMARSALARALERKPAEVEEKLQVSSKATALNVTLHLDADDVAALRRRRQEAAAASAPPTP